MHTHRKTKILCTLGPSSSTYPVIEALFHAGMNAVRLNMSHSDHRSAERMIKAIKTLNQKVKYPIPILLDTQGPEIRTGELKTDLNLCTGDVIEIAVRDVTDVEASSFHIHYDDLMETVHIGDQITVDNGLINLKVQDKGERTMTCEVIDGGVLGSKKHVNLPGIRVNLPAITEKDKRDIRFGVKNEVDFIALSFVRDAADIHQLRELLGNKANKIKVIAKIENQEGVDNLEDIVDAADGVMVARGDLGVEIPIEQLPNVQRRIARECAIRGKRVIVATHLLESMINHPIPTRAEVTDVANAVYEEVDVVMLSGETSIGKHPVRCVEYLDKISRTAEAEPGLRFVNDLYEAGEKQNLARSAVQLAESINAAGILVITRRGLMADLVTNCRPVRTPIMAVTNDSQTRRRLSLNRGVVAFKSAFSNDPEKTVRLALGTLTKKEELTSGERVVVISDVLAGSGVDAVQIRSVP